VELSDIPAEVIAIISTLYATLLSRPSNGIENVPFDEDSMVIF